MSIQYSIGLELPVVSESHESPLVSDSHEAQLVSWVSSSLSQCHEFPLFSSSLYKSNESPLLSWVSSNLSESQ